MEHLIRKMLLWFDVTEERLAAEREIDTPIDLLRWDYFQYILAHPVQQWTAPTHILYGGRDDLQDREVMESFALRFDCHLTVVENSLHPFMEPEDGSIVDGWLWAHI